MELRHLRSFCVVAEMMHVTRAARRLHIAQPALTQQIRALEAELGVPLVRREGRGIELTEAGRLFYKEARIILDQVTSACLRTREAGRVDTGRLAIGMSEASSFSPTVTKIIGSYKKKWPNVQVSFFQGRTPELTQALQDGRVDAVIGCPSMADIPDTNHHVLVSDKVLLAMPIRHRFASRRNVPIASLAQEPLIMVNHGGLRRTYEAAFLEACRQAGLSPRIIQDVPEVMLAVSLVAAGIGLSFVPAYMKDVRSDEVAYVPLHTNPPLRTEIFLVTREKAPSILAGNLKAIALSTLSNNEQAGGSPNDPGDKAEEGSLDPYG